MKMVVENDGSIRCVYGEELDLQCLGKLVIARGSHVEPIAGGHWTADLSPVNGLFWDPSVIAVMLSLPNASGLKNIGYYRSVNRGLFSFCVPHRRGGDFLAAPHGRRFSRFLGSER